MTSPSSFEQYTEALRALAVVDGLQRDALRKAVERSNSVAIDARSKVADQQRMYDRTGREIQETQRALDTLRAKLGAPRGLVEARPESGPPPTLIELRSEIAAVSQWISETEPLAESLLRSRARLSRAAAEHASSPEPPLPDFAPVLQAQPAPRRRFPLILGGGAVALTLIIVVIVVVTTIYN